MATQTGPIQMQRRALVAVSAEPVRIALVRILQAIGFEVEALEDGDAAWEWAGQNPFDLAVITRELRGIAGTVLASLLRESRKGDDITIVLASTRYQDPLTATSDLNAFGADAWLPLPATPELVNTRIQEAMAEREPTERTGLLPPQVARIIDPLVHGYTRMNYYDLLGVEEDAEPALIKRGFHQRSLLLHPDRHTRIKAGHPFVYDRMQAAYRRICEAYHVLADPQDRRAYNLGLHKRGSLRLQEDSGSQREQREVALCETDAARAHILESLELRSLGDLEGALECVDEALALEPHNTDLMRLRGAIAKLIAIIERGR